MDQKQIILFDVDGVLINGWHFRPEYRVCWNETLEADMGIPEPVFSRYVMGVFQEEVVSGQVDLHQSLSDHLPAMGYHGSVQDVIDYWLQKDSQINQPLIEIVKSLQESGKARLFIATNQEHNRARYLTENLGLGQYFEDIFYSARLGARKPYPEYFHKVDDILGREPTESVLFFDDTPKVVEAAREHGWDAQEFRTYQDVLDNKTVQAILGS